MAWNQKKIQINKPKQQKTHWMLYALGLVLFVISIFVFVLLMPTEVVSTEDSSESVTPSRTIKSVSAETDCSRNIPTTNMVAPATTNATNTYIDDAGVLRHNGGARVYVPSSSTRKVALNKGSDGHTLYKSSLFKNRAENEIARLITTEPGTALFGTRRYDARFEEEYLRSLQTPILVSKDDSPEEAELKRMMNAVKIEINDRIRGGEKLADILNETKNELSRLAEYKRTLRNEVLACIKESDNPDLAVEDYIAAANKLLEERGIAPIRGGTILKAGIIYRNKGRQK